VCYACRKLRRRRKKKEEGTESDDDNNEAEEGDVDLEDPETLILDEDGEPIENETGIITFKSDSMDVMGDLEEQQFTITVLRKNGLDGRISCKYKMEKFSATPGYDYVDEEGIVDFKNGVDKAEIEITILPKEVGEKNDQFQIILEEPTNESLFNPNSDGGSEQCLLTVTILNANPATGRLSRLFGWIDGIINMDEMRQGSAAWYDQIMESYYCNGSQEAQEEAKFLDWVMHVLFFPWKMIYAVATPPPPYLGGWVCFVVALMHIGVLTAVIGDMAELFGCVAGIPDNITAISVVALGTSLPDLFASKTAATQDEWADASIVNVTGSNSVNVFLGIGLPWMMAAVYWTMVDGTQDELWMAKYKTDFYDTGICPSGCFVVESGDLTFSVIVFAIGAIVCLSVIRIRRVVYDGELGGPAGSDSKACSSFLLVMLWVFYIALCVWKSVSGVDDWTSQIIAITICIPILILLMAFFGLMLQLLKMSKEYIGEEGFFGIAVAVSILSVRAVYFFMFQ
jgi:solute carrier family 8 (sodium/calcium exchanger)